MDAGKVKFRKIGDQNYSFTAALYNQEFSYGYLEVSGVVRRASGKWNATALFLNGVPTVWSSWPARSRADAIEDLLEMLDRRCVEDTKTHNDRLNGEAA